MEQKEYVFRRTDHEPELERLKLIEQICDPSTQRRMLATGLGRGWACRRSDLEPVRL